MSFSNSVETAVLEAVFIGTAFPWAANTELWLALFTADPTETGSISNEATFGGYARKSVTRATELSVTGNQITISALKQFDACTSGSNVITHVGIATSASGATTIIARATLDNPITVSSGVVPQFAASSLTLTID